MVAQGHPYRLCCLSKFSCNCIVEFCGRGVSTDMVMYCNNAYHWGQAPLIGFLIKTVFYIGERITISRSRQYRDVRGKIICGSGL